jgi:hypothetical protein
VGSFLRVCVWGGWAYNFNRALGRRSVREVNAHLASPLGFVREGSLKHDSRRITR